MGAKKAPNRSARGGKGNARTDSLPPDGRQVKPPRVEIIPPGQVAARMANALRFLGDPCIICGRDSRLAVVVLGFDPAAIGWMTSGAGYSLACGACLSCLRLKRPSPVAVIADSALTTKILERLSLFSPRGQERPQ